MNRRMVAFVFLSISLSFFACLQSQEGTAAKKPVAPVRPVTDDYISQSKPHLSAPVLVKAGKLFDVRKGSYIENAG